jgi:hypothetical protein
MPLDLIMGLPTEEATAWTTREFVVKMDDRAEAAYRVACDHLRVDVEHSNFNAIPESTHAVLTARASRLSSNFYD